jgi:hypothetical protein
VTTIHAAADLTEVGQPEPQQFAPEEHPEITCRTCFTQVTLINTDDVPRTDVCLGATRNPRSCNTYAFRHQTGQDRKVVAAGDDR